MLILLFTNISSPLLVYTQKGVTIRPFAYSFNVFIRCNNPRHVTASDSLSISITRLSIPSIPTLYHTPIKICIVCNFSFVPIISHQDTECHVLPICVAPPLVIILISFDLVINNLAPVLPRQGYHDLQYLICEFDRLSFSLAKIISSDTTLSLTTFHHTLSSLQQQSLLLSTNNSSSSNTLLNILVHPTSVSHRFAQHSIVLNRIVSHSIVPNCPIVSNSIAPNDNIVSFCILSRRMALWYRIVSRRMVISYQILSRRMTISYPITS